MSGKIYLSKSDFLKYYICPSYLWLWKYKKEVVPLDDEVAALHRLEQGNEVETWARRLFPEGKMVETGFDKARQETENLVKEGAETIFQATAFTDKGLLAKADVLKFDSETKTWSLHEVKSTTKVKKDRQHIEDVAFQKVAFEDSGYKIGKTYLIHLNGDYVRRGELNPSELFTEEDVSDQVDVIVPQIRAMAYDALELLKQPDEPKGCSCRLKSKSKHCPTFHYLNPDIPEYSVFNIARIGGKNLALLIDSEIYNVHEVPDDIKLSGIQKNQVEVAKSKKPIINQVAIAELLGELEFPLYFLDYEAVNMALPMYNGYKPYQQIPFQYSLHVLPSPSGSLEHFEFLDQVGKQPPEPALLEDLVKHISKSGSVVVWYKAFEASRNKEMAAAYSQYADFLTDVNARIFDLMEIFSKQHYIHHGFNGRSSIKAVLPVLVPEFSYKGMDIQGGEVAAIRWYDAVAGRTSLEQAKQTFDALLQYCGLDTLAMVKIYDKLADLVKV